MKPDWKDAPEWAQWLAMDSSGQWRWFENKPQRHLDFWASYGGRWENVNLPNEWDKSRKPRP